MRKEIREKLKGICRPEMKEMQSRIVNSSYPVLGSQVGDIRKLAREFKDDLSVLKGEPSFYEEILLEGFIIAYNKDSILEKEELIQNYIDKVDSWALIDSFCSTFKVKHSERDNLLVNLKENLDSEIEFRQRYSQIMLLSHYLKFNKNGEKLNRPRVLKKKDLDKDINNTYIEKVLELVDRPYKTYYARMGAAWLLAEAFLFFPKRILNYLGNNHLDDITYNMTIDKIRQSRNPDREVKDFIKGFKRDKKRKDSLKIT